MPTRKKNRLDGYDYGQNGAYFITICVKDRQEILGNVVEAAHPGGSQDTAMPPNGSHIEKSDIGKIVSEHIERIPSIYPCAYIDKYAVMPNHVHLILLITGGSPTKVTVAKVINALKSLTSRKIGESLWQRSYHDHIIRNEEDYIRIWQYIDENPVRWAEDAYYEKK